MYLVKNRLSIKIQLQADYFSISVLVILFETTLWRRCDFCIYKGSLKWTCDHVMKTLSGIQSRLMRSTSLNTFASILTQIFDITFIFYMKCKLGLRMWSDIYTMCKFKTVSIQKSALIIYKLCINFLYRSMGCNVSVHISMWLHNCSSWKTSYQIVCIIIVSYLSIQGVEFVFICVKYL